MMPHAILRLQPEFLTAIECPYCGSDEKNWHSCNHSDHPFGSAGQLVCQGCRTVFPVRHGYLDMRGGKNYEQVTPIQHLMQFRPAVAVYEQVWRPFGYFLASKRSFSEDARRITALLQRRQPRLLLDLACGPGVFTRRLARTAKNSTVIGFDLSHQMLERAVRLTREDGLRNVLYIRGNAMSLPFRAETFDAVSCCGALQQFPDHDQALGEIARVLKVHGDLVCQTILGPRTPPLWVRAADRLLKFGYFYLDDLKQRLSHFHFDLVDEDQSRINYIFRAAKSRSD